MMFIEKLKNRLREVPVSSQNVLVAVSGGADSVALLRGLEALRPEINLRLIVAHFNHKIRGEAADNDENWVADLSEKLEIPCYIGVAQTEPESTISEENARDQRYQFLIETAQKTGARFVVLAHHADDQAETVLHHILRGTGISGLRGIPRSRQLVEGVTLIRPMLDIRRAEIIDYLHEISQEFRIDHTNSESQFTRNRIRNELLPSLRKDFNPQFETALLRLSQQAGEYQQLVDSIVDGLESSVFVDRQENICRINMDALEYQPLLIIRSCFVRLWTLQNWPRKSMGNHEWTVLSESLQSKKSFTLPGAIDVSFRGSLMILEVRS